MPNEAEVNIRMSVMTRLGSSVGLYIAGCQLGMCPDWLMGLCFGSAILSKVEVKHECRIAYHCLLNSSIERGSR